MAGRILCGAYLFRGIPPFVVKPGPNLRVLQVTNPLLIAFIPTGKLMFFIIQFGHFWGLKKDNKNLTLDYFAVVTIV